MLSYLGGLLKDQVQDEDFRIAKQVAKQEAKLAQEEFFKEMKYKKEIGEINQYRYETVRRIIKLRLIIKILSQVNHFFR